MGDVELAPPRARSSSTTNPVEAHERGEALGGELRDASTRHGQKRGPKPIIGLFYLGVPDAGEKCRRGPKLPSTGHA